MCGIWILLKKPGYIHRKGDDICKENIKPRGPDRTVYGKNDEYGLEYAFHRLAIEDITEHGDQPFIHEDNDRIVYLFCNGEIYNHRQIGEEFNFTNFKSKSDCEKLMPLYLKYSDPWDCSVHMEHMKKVCSILVSEHVFVFIDIDKKTKKTLVTMSSDHLGMRPLFLGENETGFYISSQLNGIPNNTIDGYDVNYVERLTPRELWVFNYGTGKSIDYNKIISKSVYTDFKLYGESYKKHMETTHKFFIDENLELCEYLKPVIGERPTDEFELTKWMIRKLFFDSAYIRLHSDRPIGELLSGGLDSSIVVGVIALILTFYKTRTSTFNIGMAGSTDKPFADSVAKHVGSDHTYIENTVEDFLNSIEEVIKIIGTPDITTTRASVGQFLVAKPIAEKTDIKVVFCGEISDELCSGYKGSHKAKNANLLHEYNIELLEEIHMYDGVRVDRIMASFGLEPRFIFGDVNFVQYYLSCPPEWRMPQNGVEKSLLRESFRGTNIIPNAVLMRPKEAFSDSVSSHEKSWYQIIQEHVETLYTDQELEDAKLYYKHMPPVSKESLHYRKIFCKYYSDDEKYAKTIPHYWMHKWCGNTKEPSARAL